MRHRPVRIYREVSLRPVAAPVEGDTRALTERNRRQRLDEIREPERSERSECSGGRWNWKRWSTERQWLEQPWRREQSFPRFQSKEDISRPLASPISLSSSSPLVAGRPPAIARLVPETLRIAPAPAAASAPRSRSSLLHRGSPSFSNSSSPSCRRRSPSFSPPQDSKVRQPQPTATPKTYQPPTAAGLGESLPVGAPTTVVAPENAAHCPASGRRLLRVGNGASGIGVRTGAGAEAARGARVRVDATAKLRATCSRFSPDNISCERNKITQFRSGGQWLKSLQ